MYEVELAEGGHGGRCKFGSFSLWMVIEELRLRSPREEMAKKGNEGGLGMMPRHSTSRCKQRRNSQPRDREQKPRDLRVCKDLREMKA